MGRLSDYINGGKTVKDHVELRGLVENAEMFDHLLTTDTNFNDSTRAMIRSVLKDARKKVSRDISGYLDSDPRKAARAVKFAVYKTLFGGNLSILAKRKAGAKYELVRKRKLDENPHQRGGNRRPRSQRTKQLETYFGADRGFVLRFLNAGTNTRETRYGTRGAIGPRGVFEHTAPWQMETAAEIMADKINEYVKKVANS
jgi:hypothetical protein